ncbi:MAG: HAMP domain-containing sensor histidine kinase [Planctomycetota bacterium]|nr:HAMP domain-containing sensor histidine kinase [Planctomycetota bacterium]
MNQAPGSPRWQRRIGFRMALMLTVLLAAGYFLLPRVWNLSLRLFGLPTLDQEVIDLSDPGDARLLALNDLQFLAAYLLAEARPEEPGVWRPTLERQANVARSLARWGQTYAWLSADREVIACSLGLPFAVGDVFEQGLGHAELETVAAPFGDVAVGRIVTHVRKGGELAGWLVIYGEPPLGANAVGSSVLVEADAPAVRAWKNRVLNLTAVVSFGLVAALLAFVITRLVTRRVTRLAAEASAPVEGNALPGPFTVDGHDEITILARTLNRMRAGNEDLVARLELTDQERRRWIAQVSHDLRTPLTALTACLDRAREEQGEGVDIDERLVVAKHDATRLAELVEDLLDVARLEAGDSPVIEPVPPGELARHATRGLTALAEQGGIRLELDLAPGLPELAADGRRLMRALENLLRNALHHARSEVRLRAAQVDGHVRFAVEDDGVGFPVDASGTVDVGALAEHLSRADSAGLGLVVVRKVAEAHGGRVGARNRVEGGAYIWFEIPLIARDG